jgi:hypothetical protein
VKRNVGAVQSKATKLVVLRFRLDPGDEPRSKVCWFLVRYLAGNCLAFADFIPAVFEHNASSAIVLYSPGRVWLVAGKASWAGLGAFRFGAAPPRARHAPFANSSKAAWLTPTIDYRGVHHPGQSIACSGGLSSLRIWRTGSLASVHSGLYSGVLGTLDFWDRTLPARKRRGDFWERQSSAGALDPPAWRGARLRRG